MDRRIVRTKDAIRTAFLQILQETNDINKVTVSKITKYAEINRSTFYSYYKGISDLKETVLQDFVENLSTNTLERPINNVEEYKQTIFDLLDYIEANKQSLKYLLETDEGTNLLYELARRNVKLRMFQMKSSASNHHDLTIVTYRVFGIVAIVSQWICDELKDTREEIQDYILKLTLQPFPE